MSAVRPPFTVLFREFFGQFFASETVTSDIRLRQTIIAIAAFLITPGFILSVQVFPVLNYAQLRAPALVEPLTRFLVTIFVTFSTVSVGLIAAFVWDALSFDRRDAMILGPLPVPRSTIVAAKLAAMTAFLLGTSLAVNVVTSVPFSFASSNRFGLVFRHFAAQLVATSLAAVFVFSVIVILRSLAGMIARGHVAALVGSAMQCFFVTSLLCLIMLVPTSLNLVPRGRGNGMQVVMATLPAWLPTNWFMAIYIHLRGTAGPESTLTAGRAVLATLGAAAGAVLMTVAGFQRQLQRALAPPPSAGVIGSARINRAIAAAMVGPNRVARATGDFIITTLMRNRTQQAPVALNAAIGLALFIVGVAGRGGVAATGRAPAFVLAAPLALLYWTCIGVRASFFVPSELPASWTFRAIAPAATSAYALATRAAVVALVGPPAVLLALALGGVVGGWRTATMHAAFITFVVVALADFIVLTIDGIPFTRPYRPGHARLKTRWPLYLIGSYAFGEGGARLELQAMTDLQGSLLLLAGAAAIVAVFEWAVRHAGRRWSMQADDEVDGDAVTVTTLDLSHAGDWTLRPIVHAPQAAGTSPTRP